jgi:UDP-N-acetylmuramyl pentapeptide phosphotransferase/UDP-N-acetylglucosamine-1-phosphate transferase
VQSVPAVAVGILIVPLFDTLKVFTMRILKGKSPFNPDKTHIHHILINTGLSHLQATTVLAVVNFVFIGLAFSLQHIGTLPLLFVLLVSALALVLLAIRLEKK